MGIGAVNYWANTEVKLFEREDGLRLILEELRKRNVENYNDLLEIGGLAALATQYISIHLTDFKERQALLDYCRNQDIVPLLDKKIHEISHSGPKPSEDLAEEDFKKIMTVVSDCVELSGVKYQVAFLQGGLAKQLEKP